MSATPKPARALWSKLLDHSWDDHMGARLRSWAARPRGEVSLNLVDLKFDSDSDSVTIYGLWADDDAGKIPEDTISIDDFLTMVALRERGMNWSDALK
ncbi:MAG: hypothetical protein KDC46_02370 [Thermoleophilia bacterium]|nr:hypothetical protein [Thermoleophilia bacterium]